MASSEARQIENLPTLTKLEEEKLSALKSKLAVTDISESSAFKTFFKFCHSVFLLFFLRAASVRASTVCLYVVRLSICARPT